MTLLRRYAFPVLVVFSVMSALCVLYQYNQYSATVHHHVSGPHATSQPLHINEPMPSDEDSDPVPRTVIPMNVDDPLCPLRYTAPADRGIQNRKGRPLVVEPDMMKRMGIPYKKFVSLNEETVKDFVFATGASHNHRYEVLDGIASVQHYFPGRRIIFYDIGLTPRSRREFSLFCGVTVRVFNFTEFPPHVRDLKRYAWKPIIVQELLREFSGVLWMDASIRLHSNDMSAAYRKLLETDGVLQFKDVSHSNFAVTNPLLYQYLPTNPEQQKTTAQAIATTLMMFRTESAYWNVMHWWVLCALVEDCISPITTKYCDFKAHGGKWKLYVGCHRFDQAVISLLNSNYFGFNSTHYTLDESSRLDLLSINRTKTEYQQLLTCGINY